MKIFMGYMSFFLFLIIPSIIRTMDGNESDGNIQRFQREKNFVFVYEPSLGRVLKLLVIIKEGEPPFIIHQDRGQIYVPEPQKALKTDFSNP